MSSARQVCAALCCVLSHCGVCPRAAGLGAHQRAGKQRAESWEGVKAELLQVSKLCQEHAVLLASGFQLSPSLAIQCCGVGLHCKVRKRKTVTCSVRRSRKHAMCNESTEQVCLHFYGNIHNNQPRDLAIYFPLRFPQATLIKATITINRTIMWLIYSDRKDQNCDGEAGQSSQAAYKGGEFCRQHRYSNIYR